MPRIVIHNDSTSRDVDLLAPAVIGRAPECDLSINMDRVSRKHARVYEAAGQLLIEDLNSHNGTAVNGRLIVQPHVLNPGDEIHLGKNVRLTYPNHAASRGTGAPAPRPALFEFRCPGCLDLLKASITAAGRKGRCRACGMAIIAPLTNGATAQPVPAAISPQLTPNQRRDSLDASATNLTQDVDSVSQPRQDQRQAAITPADPHSLPWGGPQPAGATLHEVTTASYQMPGDTQPTELAMADDAASIAADSILFGNAEPATDRPFITVAATHGHRSAMPPGIAIELRSDASTARDADQGLAVLPIEPWSTEDSVGCSVHVRSNELVRIMSAEAWSAIDVLVEPTPVKEPGNERADAIAESDKQLPVADHVLHRPQTNIEPRVVARHDGPIFDLAVDEATGRIITAAGGDALHLWELDAKHDAKVLDGAGTRPWAVRFYQDGQQAISAHVNGDLVLWDLAKGAILGRFGAKVEAGISLALSPNGQTVAVGQKSGAVRLWDLPSRKRGRLIRTHNQFVTGLTFLDDRRIASVSWDGTLSIQFLQDAQAAPVTIEMGRTRHHCIACDRHSNKALTGGDHGLLQLWDLDSGTRLHQLEGHTRQINCVALSAGARWALSGGDDHTVRLWDLTTGGLLETWTDHTNWISVVAFMANDQQVLSACWNGLIHPRKLPRYVRPSLAK
jgi:hypothetical protein